MAAPGRFVGLGDDQGDLVISRHPFPSLLLNVCVLRGVVDPARVAEAVRVFPSQFAVIAPVPVPGLAGVPGLGLVGHPPLMVRPPGGTAPAPR